MRLWRYLNEPYMTTKLVVVLFLISFVCGLVSFIWRIA